MKRGHLVLNNYLVSHRVVELRFDSLYRVCIYIYFISVDVTPWMNSWGDVNWFRRQF